MSRCIIHIGMHKTGSSSIQKSLDGFENDQFLYAALGNEANHSLPIYSAFAGNPERHHLHRASGREGDAVRSYIRDVQSDLDRSIAAAHGRTLLISGEDIGVLSQQDLEKLRNYFRDKFEDLTIVGYVRPPAAFMASHFQQRVKSGSINSFNPKAMYRKYQASFGKFDQVFGRDKVQLWKFDSRTFPGGCVVQDFITRLGIAFPKKRIVRLNESLPRQAVAMLYTYAKLGEHYGARTLTGGGGMQLGLLVGGSGKFRFAPDVIGPVLDANRSDIEWMEARLGQSLREDLGELRPGDVREESDLVRPNPQMAARLRNLLGDAAPKEVKGDTPQEIALLVHALRAKHLPESARHGMRTTGEGKRRPSRGEKSAETWLPGLIGQLQQARRMLLDVFEYVTEKLKGQSKA
jgi:hypothetical protein